MANQIMIGDYDPRVDYDAVAGEIARASGAKVWHEREGDRVKIMTDSDDPNMVKLEALKSLVADVNAIIKRLDRNNNGR